MPGEHKEPKRKEQPRQQLRLTIIIPFYNAEPFTSELLMRLAPQITDEVEVIVVDDGSTEPFETQHDFVQVIRQKNQGCSKARNVGLDKAKGDYISFIDADDMVARYFVERILEKTKDEPDVIEMSWKSLTDNGWNLSAKLNKDTDRLSNPSVCTRVFKRSFIGDIRFNEKKDSTEDEDFSRRCGYKYPLGDNKPLRAHKAAVITDYMYFYRDDVSMSKNKRYAAGLMNTKRVIFYYDHVTADMTDVLDEIKKEDEVNEVFLQTNQCDIPELKRYCQISKPISTWAHIIKGEPCSHITKKPIPTKTQVVIYRRNLAVIGGLMTFIQNYVDMMGDMYDLTILCDNFTNQERLMQLMPQVRVLVGQSNIVACDTLIVLSFLDKIPQNVRYKKIVRMCHACRTDRSWTIPQDYDDLVYVSRTAMESFGVTTGKVIHNFISKKENDLLVLVSATRLPADDKGDIETRMRKLCDMLNRADISFIWLNFSDGNLKNPPKNFYNMGVCYHMESVIKKADYVVTLSDSECWSYTVLEALTNGTALITTPFPSVFEMGAVEGINAHIVPFDMDFDVNILREVPEFAFTYDNNEIRRQWIDILGEPRPFEKYKPEQSVLVKVINSYHDVVLDKGLTKGSELIMTKQRALQIINTKQNLIEIIKDI
jgi:glycosyltransferase involved in cell wall biosynthesis